MEIIVIFKFSCRMQRKDLNPSKFLELWHFGFLLGLTLLQGVRNSSGSILGKIQECPCSPGFPGIPEKARKARRQFSTLSGLCLKCKKSLDLLTLIWHSLIAGFPGKAKKQYSMLSGLFPFKKAWCSCRRK